MRERYYIEQRLKVPFAGSLKPVPEAVESSEKPVTDERGKVVGYNAVFDARPTTERLDAFDMNYPDVVFPLETAEGWKEKTVVDKN